MPIACTFQESGANPYSRSVRQRTEHADLKVGDFVEQFIDIPAILADDGGIIAADFGQVFFFKLVLVSIHSSVGRSKGAKGICAE